MRKVFHRVAAVGEIPPGQGKLVTISDRDECALFCLEDGSYFATGSLCPHQNEPLDRGRLEGPEVICRRHHLRFDIRTGNCTNAWGYSLQIYEVRVEDGNVLIGLWED